MRAKWVSARAFRWRVTRTAAGCGWCIVMGWWAADARLPRRVEGMSPSIEAPEWFTRAVTHPRKDCEAEVAGCPIHYLRWGDSGKPGLLLVHGSGAHAHWWDFIAPYFSEHYCVAAIDLS